MFARHMSPPSQLAMLCMLALTLSPPGAWGCASTRGARGGDLDGEGHDALLKLEVSPPEAEVCVNTLSPRRSRLRSAPTRRKTGRRHLWRGVDRGVTAAVEKERRSRVGRAMKVC